VAGNTAPPKNYADSQGVLELVTVDVSDTRTFVPTGNTARLRWLFCDLQDDAGPNRLTVQLVVTPNLDAGPVSLHAAPANIVGGRTKVLWSNEVGAAAVIADATGASTDRVSYNPLPLVTMDQTGLFAVGFSNGSFNNPPLAQLEIFQVGAAAAGQGNADLYLLPALG
jgi:hypothetical protein